MLLKLIPFIFIALFIGCGVYGALFYLDAPYNANTASHPCKDASAIYCGKSGKSHSLQEFQAFSNWQVLLFVSLGLAVVSGLMLVVDTGELKSSIKRIKS